MLRRALYAAYLCLAVGAAYWTGHRLRHHEPDLSEIPLSPDEARVLPRETLLRLGAVSRGAGRRSFFEFPFAKPPGVYRVGCFGESFTWGDEVAPGSDYPSRLQRLLDASGNRKYEVINFGGSWYGAHQAFLLWDEVGRRYGLDAILLGPAILRPDRDTTFSHAGFHEPAFIHSRYRLDRNGALVRLDVPGGSRAEIYRRYHALIPDWSVLRYDVQAPQALREILPRARDALGNPFYHRRDAEAEAAALLGRMIETMKSSGAKVIVGDGVFADAFRYEPETSFPYLAARGHNSPLGNELVAARYFQELVGRSAPVPRVRAEDAPWAVGGAPLAPLAEYDDARLITARGEDLGLFARNAARRPGRFDALKDARVKGLLALRPAGKTLFDSPWIEVSEPLVDGARIALEVGGRRVRLGPVRVLRPGLSLGFVDAPPGLAPSDGEFYELRAAPTPVAFERLAGTTPVRLRLTKGATSISLPFGRLVVKP